MSFDCADFQEVIFAQLQTLRLIPRDADPEGPSETADLCIAAIDRLAKARTQLRTLIELHDEKPSMLTADHWREARKAAK